MKNSPPLYTPGVRSRFAVQNRAKWDLWYVDKINKKEAENTTKDEKKLSTKKKGTRTEKEITRTDIETTKENKSCNESCKEPYFKTLKQGKNQEMLKKKKQKNQKKQSKPTNKFTYKGKNWWRWKQLLVK